MIEATETQCGYHPKRAWNRQNIHGLSSHGGFHQQQMVDFTRNKWYPLVNLQKTMENHHF